MKAACERGRSACTSKNAASKTKVTTRLNRANFTAIDPSACYYRIHVRFNMNRHVEDARQFRANRVLDGVG